MPLYRRNLGVFLTLKAVMVGDEEVGVFCSFYLQLCCVLSLCPLVAAAVEQRELCMLVAQLAAVVWSLRFLCCQRPTLEFL